MKRVYSSLNSMLVDNLHNVLRQEGIACEVRNRHAGSLLGEIPISEAFTELWVEDEHSERAEQVVQGFVEEAEAPSYDDNWICAVCNTEIDKSLDACWNCAKSVSQEEQQTEGGTAFAASQDLASRINPLVLWIGAALLGLWWMSTRL